MASRIAPGITLWLLGMALSVGAFLVERRTGWRRHAEPKLEGAMTTVSISSVYNSSNATSDTSTTTL